MSWKYFFVFVSFLNFSMANANTIYIQDSTYVERHQKLVYLAALESCKVNGGMAKQISSSEEIEQIDSGIFDSIFNTILELTVQIDNGVWDTYIVDIKSRKSDMYDHNYKDWWAYGIEETKCYQE